MRREPHAARTPLLAALALVLGASLLLTGCSGPTDPEPPSVAPSTGTTPTPEPVVLPADCAALNATANDEATAAAQEFGLQGPAEVTDLAGLDAAAGPVAQEAMTTAPQRTGCVYPVYLNGQDVTEWAAELPAAEQQPVIEELRASGFTESTLGDAVRFTLSQHEEDQPGMPGSGVNRDVTALFIGDVWVFIVSSGEQDYAQAALDGILAANPALGGNGDTADAPPATGTSTCSGLTGEEALSTWGAGVDGGPWDLTGQYSDVAGYDECAALSWIVLRPEPCCTRFSITPVLFFHDGEYVPEATVLDYAVDSASGAQRRSDAEIAVTFMWPGSDSAGPANTATSVFTWDEATGTVVRTGDLPPSRRRGRGRGRGPRDARPPDTGVDRGFGTPPAARLRPGAGPGRAE